MATHLHIDIETFSEVSIAECGAYRYAMDPSFRILLCAYSWDDEPVRIIEWGNDPSKERTILSALTDGNIIKHAHNASFERICFSVELRRRGELSDDQWLDPIQWRCSMVQAARCGLPLSLAQVGEVLGFEKQKMTEGKKLIEMFCTPQDPKHGLFHYDKRVRPEDYPEHWQTFKDYCVRDVEVERQICDALAWYEVSDAEQELYATDQRINDRGVMCDIELARQASKVFAFTKAALRAEAIRISGLSNPNSVEQLKTWIGQRTGRDMKTLNKDDLADLLKVVKDPDVRRVIQIRQQSRKNSNSKYDTMLASAGPDDRVRGMIQFYGSHTGRWAGRLVQLQNLPQNHMDKDELFDARQMLREGDSELISLLYGDILDITSQLIRTAFMAPQNKVLCVCDFSAIEARLLAWMAGEQWVLDTFRNGGDIYCATASQMFGVPVEKHGQNSELRQKGKIAVLALGYQGNVGALDAMGGQRMGLTEQEEKEIVAKWRKANPNIVRFWRKVLDAAVDCFNYGTMVHLGNLTFEMHDKDMIIQLPSGRKLVYVDMMTTTNRFGGTSLKYKGIVEEENDKGQKSKIWGWIETHGGKLTENIIQAIGRDCLAEVMVKCEAEGLPVVFHIHDELVCECSSEKDLETMKRIFSEVPEWAGDLPLKGAGYVTPYYFKD